MRLNVKELRTNKAKKPSTEVVFKGPTGRKWYLDQVGPEKLGCFKIE